MQTLHDKEQNEYQMILFPNRSFELKNLKFLFGFVFVGFLIPILPFMGSRIGTFLLFFSMLTLIFFSLLFIKSYSGAKLREIVKINAKEISIMRVEPNGKKNFWKTNSYWAKVKFYPSGQIVDNYLTLVGENREIELGSYLSPEERFVVRGLIEKALYKVKSPL